MSYRNKFAALLGVLALLAAIYYFATVNRSNDLSLIGTVDSNQVIVSAKIPGRIERLLVDEGSKVKQGDVIAELDRAELEAQVRAAQAQLAALGSKVSAGQATAAQARGETSSDVAAARALLHEAQADLERVQLDNVRIVRLADEGVASQQDRDRSNASLKAAQARVKSLQDQLRSAEARTHQASVAASNLSATRSDLAAAQAQLAEAQTRLGYTQVLAPVTGTVSVRAARQGEVVAASQPIVTLVDLTDVWVRAAVPETESDAVALGDSLQVRLPSGRMMQGTVIFKGVEADFATQRDVGRSKRDIKTVVLKVRVDNRDERLTPGMTAEVLVPPRKP
jgi:multidrug resistance efflux pump